MNDSPFFDKLEKVLNELNFTSENIDKVKHDLVNLIKNETATELLEELPQVSKDTLNKDLVNIPDSGKPVYIADFLKRNYSQEQIDGKTRTSADLVLKDYLDNLIKNLNDRHKALLLQELISQEI